MGFLDWNELFSVKYDIILEAWGFFRWDGEGVVFWAVEMGWDWDWCLRGCFEKGGKGGLGLSGRHGVEWYGVRVQVG